MKFIVSLKIDVTKIDKARLFKGAKGTYLDCTLMLDEDPDEYENNGMITQSISKEERDADVKGAILGNSKIHWKGESQPRTPAQKPAPPTNFDTADDDIPF